MRRVAFILAVAALAACGHSDKKGAPGSKDSIVAKKDSLPVATTVEKPIDSNLLFSVSTDILSIMKQKNYDSLASYFHPVEGVRFAPFTFTDSSARVLKADEFRVLAKTNKKIGWSLDWLDEDPDTLLTVKQYFNRYVYDVDFLKAPSRHFDQYIPHGTVIDNAQDFYPGASTVEYFFDGFEKKYDGMDFRGLRLVYRMYGGKPYLVGLVHNEWTP